MSEHYDFYADRLIIALILGVSIGFFVGRWYGNYIVWITLTCAISFGIEIVTRVSYETKKMHPDEKMNMPSMGFKSPRPPKPPKVV